MTYNDTSKQIRARIARKEQSLFRRIKPQRRQMFVTSLDVRAAKIEDLALKCKEQIDKGDAYWAGNLASAAVHYALIERAAEIQHDLHRAYWKAMAMARIEIFQVAPAPHADGGGVLTGDRLQIAPKPNCARCSGGGFYQDAYGSDFAEQVFTLDCECLTGDAIAEDDIPY